MLSRRAFVAGGAGCCAGTLLPARAAAQRSGRTDHYATGTEAGVSSTSLQASEAALWALEQGGNAADAYVTAALTQTVSEPGLTSLGGAFGMQYFDAGNKETSYTAGLLGPAAAEPYDYDRESPVTQTGRAMPVPGYVAGVFDAHRRYGRLDWAKLFQPAIRHAKEGFLVIPDIIEAAKRKAINDPASKELWHRDGHFLKADEPLVQTRLGELLSAIAKDGPAAFYTGDFARHYVKRAQSDGGKITLKDLENWKTLIRTPKVEVHGNYRGYQVASAPLIVYALHLNEALDLRSSKSAATSPETVFKQLRIMEEVFLSGKTLNKDNKATFVDPAYARKRADFVLNGPRREFTLDALFNTCFLVVRDAKGNCAWGTHSINAPSAFGAGIMVDGVYASYAINRGHVHGDGATAPGITTSYALFKDGAPRLVVGSPGFGFVHGPYQFGTAIVEWDMSPVTAMNLPRFSMPNAKGEIAVERHYDAKVLEMINSKKIPHHLVGPSGSTGIVGALFTDDHKKLHFAQDGRRSGFARAK
jgi:gamma-glutamyltranspeptidase / glutathione hydrolase